MSSEQYLARRIVAGRLQTDRDPVQQRNVELAREDARLARRAGHRRR